MLLSPKKEKYRKAHKGRVRIKVSKRGNSLAFGSFGLKALSASRVTARQIEAARKAAIRCMRRQGKLWIKIFPDIPVSKKPAEVRMGKGKGSSEFFIFRVSPGRILFEVDGVSQDMAEQAFALAGAKLPLKTKMVVCNG